MAPVISAAARTRAHVSLMLLPWVVDTSLKRVSALGEKGLKGSRGELQSKTRRVFPAVVLASAGGRLLGFFDGRVAKRGPAGRRSPSGRPPGDPCGLPGGTRGSQYRRREACPPTVLPAGAPGSRPSRPRAHAPRKATPRPRSARRVPRRPTRLARTDP